MKNKIVVVRGQNGSLTKIQADCSNDGIFAFHPCEHRFAGRCANLSNEDIFMSAMRADEFFEAKKKIS